MVRIGSIVIRVNDLEHPSRQDLMIWGGVRLVRPLVILIVAFGVTIIGCVIALTAVSSAFG